ncbi:MAG: RHS repeat-associated core domain-containing protein [Pseudorhodobacter sp.]|nr:RHS repeat-associated core domain-containing protein [Frankiaceae bacterium]
MTPDASGRVGRIRAVTGTTVQSDLSYTYSRMVGATPTDGALTRSRTDNTATGVAGLTTTYGYDSLSRLSSATERSSAGAITADWAYGYDPAGNRTSATLSPQGTGATTAFTHNDANQILTRAGAGGFAYDANGNETAAVGVTTRTSGTWNAKQQLTGVTAAGTAVPFTYTGEGNQSRLTVAGTSLRNTALGVTAQTTSGATTTFVRDPGGTLIATRTGTTSNYYLFDGLGSVVGLVDTLGTKTASYSYDPYGQSRTASGTVTNPYRYTGGYLDITTGLTKLGIRYYDPTLGRFTQTDPAGQDPHYSYAGNSPSSFLDPSGASLVSAIRARLQLSYSACVGICGGVTIQSGNIYISTGGSGLQAPGVSIGLSERSLTRQSACVKFSSFSTGFGAYQQRDDNGDGSYVVGVSARGLPGLGSGRTCSRRAVG